MSGDHDPRADASGRSTLDTLRPQVVEVLRAYGHSELADELDAALASLDPAPQTEQSPQKDHTSYRTRVEELTQVRNYITREEAFELAVAADRDWDRMAAEVDRLCSTPPSVTCPTCHTQMTIKGDYARCENLDCKDWSIQRMWTDDQQLIGRQCWYGHKARQVGCVSCVLVFDRPAALRAASLDGPRKEK